MLTPNNDAYDFPALQGWIPNKEGKNIQYIPEPNHQGTCQISSTNWETSCKPNGIKTNFFLTYIAYFRVDQNGKYTIAAYMDDAGEIFIDNEKVISIQQKSGGIDLNTKNVSAKVQLKKGIHRIIMMIFEVEGGWRLKDINLTDPNGKTVALHTLLVPPSPQ